MKLSARQGLITIGLIWWLRGAAFPLAGVGLVACGSAPPMDSTDRDSADLDPTANDAGPAGTDVYVAGRERNGSHYQAMLWKNGMATALTDGATDADAFAVAASGDDVYVAGYETRAYALQATIWRNGLATALRGTAVPGLSTEARSLTLSGHDVHAAGHQWAIAMAWKNGVAKALTDGSQEAGGHSVAVSGSDVYVAGYETTFAGYDGGEPYFPAVAKVWKNGVATTLTDGTRQAWANSVAVSGDDVYVAGVDGSVAKVWKNGVATALTDGSRLAEAYSVAVSGSDVYVAGFTTVGGWRMATLWKNGAATALTQGLAGEARSVAVSGSDVYVAGDQTEGSGRAATVWKNGVATRLADGARNSSARSVFVHVR